MPCRLPTRISISSTSTDAGKQRQATEAVLNPATEIAIGHAPVGSAAAARAAIEAARRPSIEAHGPISPWPSAPPS